MRAATMGFLTALLVLLVAGAWWHLREHVAPHVIPAAPEVAVDTVPDERLVMLYPDGRRAGRHDLEPGDSVEVCAHLQRGDSLVPLPPDYTVDWRATGGVVRLSPRATHCVWLIRALSAPAPRTET